MAKKGQGLERGDVRIIYKTWKAVDMMSTVKITPSLPPSPWENFNKTEFFAFYRSATWREILKRELDEKGSAKEKAAREKRK
jgi:hypothetical protein